MKTGEHDSKTYAYEDPRYTEMLIARLAANELPFQTQEKQGVIYVVLEMEHKSPWTPIREEIDVIWLADISKQFDAAEN